MFAKKKKAKKSINALVLAATAAGSIALPSLHQTLASLRLAIPGLTSPPNSPPSAFAAAKHRTQSMGEARFHTPPTPTPPKTVAFAPNPPTTIQPPAAPKRSTANAAVVAPAAEEEDWDKEFLGPSSTSSNHPSTTPGAPLLPFPRAPATRATLAHQQRRVVSAPSFAHPPPSFDFPTPTSTTNTSAGVVDVLWEDAGVSKEEDAFLTAGVKHKILQRREKELERSVSADAGLESWDDDFVVDGEEEEGEKVVVKGHGVVASGLKIPSFLSNVQDALRTDSNNLRKFALHIEDLKLIYMDALDMAFGLDFDHPDLLAPLTARFTPILETAQVLIHLGDFRDNVNDTTSAEKLATDALHLRVLADLLPGREAEIKSLAQAKMKMQFHGELVGVLMERIGGVKKEVAEYLGELSKISREV
ncbi:hypothetical protein HDU98_000243 [Podochytrium sp. JEL0797]|nr:hypothetical protein HDU98_000243 [Podochytrium sp. JEL0797]